MGEKRSGNPDNLPVHWPKDLGQPEKKQAISSAIEDFVSSLKKRAKPRK